MHGHEVGGFAVILAALAGLESFDKGDSRMYIDMALAGLSPERLRRFQEDLMRAHPIPMAPFPTPRADALIDAIGQWQAAVALQRALLRVLGRRGVALEPEQLEVILECRSHDRLESWIDRAATASMAVEVFGD